MHPEKFHGAGPFKVSTGEPLQREWGPSYSSLFGDALIRIAKKDDKVLAITAAMGEGTGLREFSEKLPDRFFDVGIAEQHAVTFAAGLALAGFKPVVAIYSTFLQRAYDQLYHDVCLMDLPVLFVLDRAGIVPDDGPTHQGVNDIAYMRHMPNMIVMAPKDENELQHMLWSGLHLRPPGLRALPQGQGPGRRARRRAPGPAPREERARPGRPRPPLRRRDHGRAGARGGPGAREGRDLASPSSTPASSSRSTGT